MPLHNRGEATGGGKIDVATDRLAGEERLPALRLIDSPASRGTGERIARRISLHGTPVSGILRGHAEMYRGRREEIEGKDTRRGGVAEDSARRRRGRAVRSCQVFVDADNRTTTESRRARQTKRERGVRRRTRRGEGGEVANGGKTEGTRRKTNRRVRRRTSYRGSLSAPSSGNEQRLLLLLLPARSIRRRGNVTSAKTDPRVRIRNTRRDDIDPLSGFREQLSRETRAREGWKRGEKWTTRNDDCSVLDVV